MSARAPEEVVALLRFIRALQRDGHISTSIGVMLTHASLSLARWAPAEAEALRRAISVWVATSGGNTVADVDRTARAAIQSAFGLPIEVDAEGPIQ